LRLVGNRDSCHDTDPAADARPYHLLGGGGQEPGSSREQNPLQCSMTLAKGTGPFRPPSSADSPRRIVRLVTCPPQSDPAGPRPTVVQIARRDRGGLGRARLGRTSFLAGLRHDALPCRGAAGAAQAHFSSLARRPQNARFSILFAIRGRVLGFSWHAMTFKACLSETPTVAARVLLVC